jgi:hypothetical protein
MTPCPSTVDRYQYFLENAINPDNGIIAFLKNVVTHQADMVVSKQKGFSILLMSVVSFTDFHKNTSDIHKMLFLRGQTLE